MFSALSFSFVVSSIALKASFCSSLSLALVPLIGLVSTKPLLSIFRNLSGEVDNTPSSFSKSLTMIPPNGAFN